MAKAINVRLTEDSERALRRIQQIDGLSASDAVRTALIEAEERRCSDEAIRAAVARIAADPNERRIAKEWLDFQDEEWFDGIDSAAGG